MRCTFSNIDCVVLPAARWECDKIYIYRNSWEWNQLNTTLTHFPSRLPFVRFEFWFWAFWCQNLTVLCVFCECECKERVFHKSQTNSTFAISQLTNKLSSKETQSNKKSRQSFQTILVWFRLDLRLFALIDFIVVVEIFIN